MASAAPAILLVDDEPHSLSAMKMALEDEFEILTALGADEAIAALEENWVQVIFCDQRMPGRSGVELLTEVRERWPQTVRIVITGYTDSASMISAINNAGIHQFIAKPWHPEQLLAAARNAARMFQLARENERLSLEMRFLNSTTEAMVDKRRRALREGTGFDAILRAPGSAMNQLVALARQYASFDVPVLVTGEAGTGKALIARAMHYGSLRADKPFYEINIAGMPEELAMIELFGAKRGVLPGGISRVGLAQKADRGTLYIAGIESSRPALQLALLRMLTEGVITPVGGQETVTTNLRLITGASADLHGQVGEGCFRADLYYAMSLGEVPIMPLRARRADIAILAQSILAEAASTHGKPVMGIDPAALDFLENYDWPGNIRELTNEVTRMLIFATGEVLGAELISRRILQAAPGDEGHDRAAEEVMTAEGTLKDRIELIEMRILRETLTRNRWNKSRAAAELGLSRVGLRAKLERYGIADPAVALQEENG